MLKIVEQQLKLKNFHFAFLAEVLYSIFLCAGLNESEKKRNYNKLRFLWSR